MPPLRVSVPWGFFPRVSVPWVFISWGGHVFRVFVPWGRVFRFFSWGGTGVTLSDKEQLV